MLGLVAALSFEAFSGGELLGGPDVAAAIGALAGGALLAHLTRAVAVDRLAEQLSTVLTTSVLLVEDAKTGGLRSVADTLLESALQRESAALADALTAPVAGKPK